MTPIDSVVIPCILSIYRSVHRPIRPISSARMPHRTSIKPVIRNDIGNSMWQLQALCSASGCANECKRFDKRGVCDSTKDLCYTNKRKCLLCQIIRGRILWIILYWNEKEKGGGVVYWPFIASDRLEWSEKFIIVWKAWSMKVPQRILTMANLKMYKKWLWPLFVADGCTNFLYSNFSSANALMLL